jgi:hypothetical protein
MATGDGAAAGMYITTAIGQGQGLDGPIYEAPGNAETVAIHGAEGTGGGKTIHQKQSEYGA